VKPGEGPLALLLAMKDKGKKKPEPDDDDEDGGGADGLLREAYSAMREKDEEGFVASMKAAIKACYDEE
jgi:hypothetical protein